VLRGGLSDTVRRRSAIARVFANRSSTRFRPACDIGASAAESIYWLLHGRFRFSKAKRMVFLEFFPAPVRYKLSAHLAYGDCMNTARRRAP
jgi:hypothetical protein